MFFKNLDYAAGWLAGIIDGEGCVSDPSKCKLSNGRIAYRRVSICNTDTSIIARAEEALSLFGIKHGKQTLHHENPKWATTYNLFIQKRSELEKLADVVKLASSKKQKHLLNHLAYFQQKDIATSERIAIVSKLYLKDRLSMAQIGGIVGIKESAVALVLKKQGIKISLSEAALRYWERKSGNPRLDERLVVEAYHPPAVSITDLVNKFHRSYKYIRGVLERNGVPILLVTPSEKTARSWNSRDRSKASKTQSLVKLEWWRRHRTVENSKQACLPISS
ncbi:MAG TPA: LAGLIDADG family homing endonuclease [Nitrososphaera sp.]|nr:LAGLIDADG family homing endonuclease [Nitrososphaera sp.]